MGHPIQMLRVLDDDVAGKHHVGIPLRRDRLSRLVHGQGALALGSDGGVKVEVQMIPVSIIVHAHRRACAHRADDALDPFARNHVILRLHGPGPIQDLKGREHPAAYHDPIHRIVVQKAGPAPVLPADIR